MRKIASRLSVALVAVLLLTQCTSPAVQQDKRAPVLLAVFAHPDDESTVSMVLAKYAAAGVKVYLATATDGRLGVAQHAGIPAGDTLAAARVKELNCTTEKLGIGPPIMFGLWDQLKMGEGLQPHMDQLREMRERVTKLFEELQPDAVITWGPSGWTGHPDHRLVSDIVTEVFQSRNMAEAGAVVLPGRAEQPGAAEQSDSARAGRRQFSHRANPGVTSGLRQIESRLAVSRQSVHACADRAAVSVARRRAGGRRVLPAGDCRQREEGFAATVTLASRQSRLH